MTLTTRLSVFFLAALAVVVAGFSLAVYLMAHRYLHRQVDDRLEAALDTLSAAAEVSSEGVEWEPEGHRITLGRDDGPDQVRWFVCDSQALAVDRSANSTDNDFVADCARRMLDSASTPYEASKGGQTWRMAQRRVPDPSIPITPDSNGHNHSDNSDAHDKFHSGLALTTALSLEPIRLTLRNLAVALGALALAGWLLAAFVGRWVCRRALAPVTEMATAARGMGAADRHQRLPVAKRGDELEDLGRAFNDLLGRLDESFEQQRRFTGDASHQLRTPLTAMLGQIEVSLRRDRSPEEYKQTLSLIHGQAGQLSEIVESLLFLARADADAMLLQLDAVDFAAWLSEHAACWKGHPRFDDLRLMAPTKQVLVMAQSSLLGQLLDNLWDNACKYSEPGTPIAMRIEEERNAVALIVQDAGRGIAEEDLAHIFKPFYRSARERMRGAAGIGLGLAVAGRIATAVGGTLEAESKPGEGSRFTLRLATLESGRSVPDDGRTTILGR
jgi:two-component system OmpR family sensor kinase